MFLSGRIVLFHVLLEESGGFGGPVAWNLVLHLGIEVILLVGFGSQQVVEGSDIGVRRACAVLQAAAGHHCAGDAGCQILGVEI